MRVVHGDKEMEEKVGRNDLCPCESGKLFEKGCRNTGCFRRRESGPLLLGNEPMCLLDLDGRAGLVVHPAKANHASRQRKMNTWEAIDGKLQKASAGKRPWRLLR